MGKLLFVLLCTALLAVLVAPASAHAYDYYFGGGDRKLKISSETQLEPSYLSSYVSEYGVTTVTLDNQDSLSRIHVTLSSPSGLVDDVILEVKGNFDIILANLQMVRNGSPIDLRDNYNGTLILRGSNILTSHLSHGLKLMPGAEVSIVANEPAFLLAQGGQVSAGIRVGRSEGGTCAKLNIHSGTVTAISGPKSAQGWGGAGIGGANNESGGVINIFGGVVTAIGDKGAGIGGGNRSAHGGEITIEGGTVIAVSVQEGAGIGGGDDDSDGGEITITGGFVTAVGGPWAAGIGGGNNGTSGNILITGGTVIATGGAGGAGIGGGQYNNQDGGKVDTIRIVGGVIFASGGRYVENGVEKYGEDIGIGYGGDPDVGAVSIPLPVPEGTPAILGDPPPAVFLRNNRMFEKMYIYPGAYTYTRIGDNEPPEEPDPPRDYEGISAYGIELSSLFGDPEEWPVITAPGVQGPGDNWLTNLWTNQINHWKETQQAGAYLWLNTITYFESPPSGEPGDVFEQSQHKGTTGEILSLDDTGFITPQGYVFKTWKTSAQQKRDPGAEHTFLSELWLFPVWEPIQYQITYELNGGEFTTTYPTTYTIETQTFTLINPAKTGYIFAGWTGTGIEGDDPVLEVTIEKGSTGDREYTAHWELPFRTLTDSATGISVSGYIRSDAELTVGEMELHGDACEACNAIRQWMNDDDYVLLLGNDISLSHEFSGTLTITIPVEAQYNGLNVTILQCAAGTLHTYTATVADEEAVFNVTSLSPFALFAEDDDPPTVATDPVTKVSATGATFNGSVIDDGGAEVIERGFVYSKGPDPVIGGAGVTKVAAGSGTGSFTAALTKLKPDTTYYVCAYAANSEGTAYGAVVRFKTDKAWGVLPATGFGIPWIWWLLCGLAAAGLFTFVVLSKPKKA